MQHAQYKPKRQALWASIRKLSPPATSSGFFLNARNKVQAIYDKCRVIDSFGEPGRAKAA